MPDIPVAQRRSRYILVVEDEDLIQMLLATYLEEFGFQVALAGCAAEAKAKMRLLGSVVAGALIDMVLPDSRGDVLLRELRELHPGLSAIISSGSDRATLQGLFTGVMQVDYLSKPFNQQQLREALCAVGLLS